MAFQDDLNNYINGTGILLDDLVSAYGVIEVLSACPYKAVLGSGVKVGFLPLSGPNTNEVAVVGIHPMSGGFWTQLSKDNVCMYFVRNGNSDVDPFQG